MTQHGHVALGVDIGTTNTKIVVVEIADTSVREIRRVSVPTPADGAALRQAVLRAIDTVTRAGGKRIESVGIASMAETGTLIDRDDEPSGGLLRWNDGVGDHLRGVVSSVGADALYAATGVPLPAKTPVAHWLRLAEAGHPDLASYRWGGAADLIALALTGNLVTDHTLAARTMAYRSTPFGETALTRFDPDLAELGGFSPDRLPDVAEPGSAAGMVTARAASETGLTAGIPVFVAGHDHAVGAWAAGVRTDGQVANSVGTAEALFRVSETPIDRDAARRAGMSMARTVDGDHESLLAGNPTAGALVEWAFATIFLSSDRERTFADAAGIASRWTGEPLVLPYLRGRQSPHPDPRAIFDVLDRSGRPASLPSADGDALAAILGGLVLQLAWVDSVQNDVLGAGATGETIHVLGGPGASNDAWFTLKHRLLLRDLRRVDFPEPVAAGAAMLAACSVTGMSPALPAIATDEGGSAPATDRAEGDERSALLADFIAAATGALDSDRQSAARFPSTF